jgi:hypothetical protein
MPIHTLAKATFMLTSIQGHVTLKYKLGILEVSSIPRLHPTAQTIPQAQDQIQWQGRELYGT